MGELSLQNPLVVSEFPKSGGSWIVSMLGDVLKWPCRDIYMRPGFSLFDWTKHPWYDGASELDFPEKCVIKSHELPSSGAIDFDASMVHLVRDGRDVVVSKFFFDRDFCVKNGIVDTFDANFDEYVEETAREWAHYVKAWRAMPGVTMIRYEDFLCDPVVALGTFVEGHFGLTMDAGHLSDTVNKFTRERFSASLNSTFEHNTFVRKGIAGDWRNHFSRENCAVFEAVAGEALLSLGYGADWPAVELQGSYHLPDVAGLVT